MKSSMAVAILGALEKWKEVRPRALQWRSPSPYEGPQLSLYSIARASSANYDNPVRVNSQNAILSASSGSDTL